ncbi:MAG: hypothetical protein LBI29_02425 [Rickettsiales bacterium]|jgi:UDPglucose 6-dehydrogenase|nr:hypothetical protein [Rickettsiales bacterium]
MNILLVGAGYVGLPTTVFFAKMEHSVLCYDNNSEKITKLKQGYSVIFQNRRVDISGAGLRGIQRSLERSLKIRLYCVIEHWNNG